MQETSLLESASLAHSEGDGDATESVSNSGNKGLSDSESATDSKWGGKL